MSNRFLDFNHAFRKTTNPDKTTENWMLVGQNLNKLIRLKFYSNDETHILITRLLHVIGTDNAAYVRFVAILHSEAKANFAQYHHRSQFISCCFVSNRIRLKVCTALQGEIYFCANQTLIAEKMNR